MGRDGGPGDTKVAAGTEAIIPSNRSFTDSANEWAFGDRAARISFKIIRVCHKMEACLTGGFTIVKIGIR